MNPARKAEIDKALRQTADKGGLIKPERVVAAAQNPKNILHDEFARRSKGVWDDATAAHQHRLNIAREMIREIRYVPHEITQGVRQISYVHDPRTADQGYIELSTAAGDRNLSKQIMLAELKRCESAIGRAREVSDALGMLTELDKLLADVILIKLKVAA